MQALHLSTPQKVFTPEEKKVHEFFRSATIEKKNFASEIKHTTHQSPITTTMPL